MEKKIAALLNNNLRVIIPDFGAFVIRQQEPRIVVFNEFLKNNDGLLLDHIMKTENVDCDVAQQLLSDFTSHAIRTLDSGGILIIEGIGKMKKDPKGMILLLPENETVNFNEPEPVRLTVTEDQLPFDKSQVAEAYPGLQPLTLKKILNKQVVRWAGVILAANIIVILFFVFKDPVLNNTGAKKKSSVLDESVVKQLADSVMAAVNDSNMVMSDGPPALVTDETQEAVSENLRYYIVAGCFRDEINADELVGSLKNMGYKAEKFGKIGDLFAVSFASFDDKELAVKELARIRKDFHPDAWMTRF